ncbi:MAG: helix-turn-helix transcriptional regulator [Methylococcaceae bacterium]|nr:helix-turn-helix transcriptional regulator [Methylococcaceae bacterium]
MNADFSSTLIEQDYLDVLTFIKELSLCRTHIDLHHLLNTSLLNVLDASSCFYCFTDPDFAHVQVLDAINIPESTFSCLQDLIKYDPLGQRIIELQRPVMAYDVDFPRQNATDTLKLFFQEHPEHEASRQLYWQHFACSMGALNLPDATVGVGVHRLLPLDHPFTFREIRILELIRPSLMQTIRSLILSDELKRYHAFADCLATIDSPLALIQQDWRIIYNNRSFDALWPETDQHWLPEGLIQVLIREIYRCSPQDLNGSPLEIPFYRFNKRIYRPVLARIEVEADGDWLWLLRMNRVVDGYSKMLRRLQEMGLSSREIEVCILVRDSLDTRKIAERLCISYNTVRNHIGKIYLKTDVNTRTQLIELMNQ